MANPKPGQRRCIWCESNKFFHPKPSRGDFNSEDILLSCFGSFKHTLTLTEQVCKTCNQAFGDDVDRCFGRGGINGYLRFKHNDKPAKYTHQFDHNDFELSIADSPGSAWNGLPVKLTNENDSVQEKIPLLISIKSSGGKWQILTEEELDKIEQLQQLNLDFPVEIDFHCAPAADVTRLLEKLRTKGGKFGEINEVSQPPSLVIGKYNLTPKRQRALVKMGIEYLARVGGKANQHILFSNELKSAKEFALKGVDPGYGLVVNSLPIDIIDKESRQSLRQGHTMSIAFYNYNGRNQLVFQISIYGTLTQAIHLAPDYRGVLFPLRKAHHWDISKRICKEVVLVDRYCHLIC